MKNELYLLNIIWILVLSGFINHKTSSDSMENNPSKELVVYATDPTLDVEALNTSPTCDGASVQLMAITTSNATQYEWTGPNGFFANIQNPLIDNASPYDSGIYTVTITDNLGCTGSASTTVQVSSVPVVTAISVQTGGDACVSGTESISLHPSIDDGDGVPGDAGAPYTYAWFDGSTSFSSDSIAVLPNATAANNGTYTLVVRNSDACASSPFEVEVFVFDQPNTPSLTINEHTPCLGTELILTTELYEGIDVTYSWYRDGILLGNTTIPTYTIPNVTFNASGDYTLSVTVGDCTSENAVAQVVDVQPLPATPDLVGMTDLCAGDTLFLETTDLMNTTYEWAGPNDFSFSNSNPMVNIPEPTTGYYTVQTVVNGCVSVADSLLVNVHDKPLNPILESNSPICIDDNTSVLTLTISEATRTEGASYAWWDATNNLLLGISGTSPSFNLNDFSNYQEGVYEFYAIVSNTCILEVGQSAMVIFNSIPSQAAEAGIDQNLCNELSTSLGANAPTHGIGTWTQLTGPPATILTPNAPNTTVEDLEAGHHYTFRWTLSNGACGDYSADDMDITVIAATQVAEAGFAEADCFLTTTQLNAVPASSGNIGTWTQSPTQAQLGVGITSPNDPNTEVTGLSVGSSYEFTWTLSNNSCGDFSLDVVPVEFAPFATVAQTIADTTICGTNTIRIPNQLVDNCVGEWSAQDPELVIMPVSETETLIMDLKEGTNVLTWSLDCGPCGSSSTDLVIEYEAAAIAAPDLVTIPFGESLTFNILGNDILPTNYDITLVDMPDDGTLVEFSTGIYTYVHDGQVATPDNFTYQICNTNCVSGCSELTTVSILVEVDCNIPSIITPNDDGMNDTFIVECLYAIGKYPNNIVTIYNQWGDEVFRQENYLNDWSGMYQGEPLPTGTYFYTVDFGDGTEVQAGFLLIER